MRSNLTFWGLTIKSNVIELCSVLGEYEHDYNTDIPVWYGIFLGEETDEQALLFDVYYSGDSRKFLKDELLEWRINSEGSFNCLKIKDFLIEKLLNLRLF